MSPATPSSRFAKTSWGTVRTRHTESHEALIQTFTAEGWPRADAEYQAAKFRSAFRNQTDAERIAIRERALEQIAADRAAAVSVSRAA